MLASPAPLGDDTAAWRGAERPWALGWALGGGVAGTALQLQQAALWPWPLYLAIALLGALGLCMRHRAAWVWAGLAFFFALAGLRAAHMQSTALPEALEGMDIELVGRVASLPVPGVNGERFELVVEQARHRGAAVAVPQRLMLVWYGGPLQREGGWQIAHPSPGLVAGDRWAFTVRLKRAHGAFNPHGFDRERWLWEQGILATGYVRNGARDEPPRHLGPSGRHPVDRLRQQVAERIGQSVSDARAAGVLAALVVGDQAAIERSDWELYRASGVAHLMAISGLHITLFAWIATALLGATWRRLGRPWPALPMRWPTPWVAGWGGLLLALAYAVFSGWGVPAQRTVLMLCVVVALRLSVRHWPWPAVWLLVMAAVLLFDPWAMLSAGFWLSFVAVGILFASDPMRRRAVPGAPVWRRAATAAQGLWREQAVMTVALAPLSLLLFGQVSVVGVVANLLAIPWVTLIVTPMAMLGVAVEPLWQAAAWAVQAMGVVLVWLTDRPWAVLHRPTLPLALALSAAIGGVLVVLRLPPLWRAAGALLCLPALAWQAPRPAYGEFELLAIDVGQGSSVLLRTATHSLLYDTGPRWNPEADAGERIVLPLLRALGERPHTVVVSHSDTDHAGGMQALRLELPEARWLTSFDADPARRCQAGQRWVWDGVAIEVLHPAPGDYTDAGLPRLPSNAMSCVLRIHTPRASAWLAGDLPAEQEVRLALQRPHERADWLLAPHHGSKTSSSPVLLNTLQPRWVVVQAGYRNRFGHPAPVVTQRYDARGIEWTTSPACGAALWRSENPDELRCERSERQRYWHHRPGDIQARH